MTTLYKPGDARKSWPANNLFRCPRCEAITRVDPADLIGKNGNSPAVECDDYLDGQPHTVRLHCAFCGEFNERTKNDNADKEGAR